MKALLPPSSSETRFKSAPAVAPIERPTLVEPVKLIMLTFESFTSASPTSAPPGRMCKRPGGKPAASKSCAKNTPPHTGDCGSGFSRTALTVASAGATARAAAGDTSDDPAPDLPEALAGGFTRHRESATLCASPAVTVDLAAPDARRSESCVSHELLLSFPF